MPMAGKACTVIERRATTYSAHDVLRGGDLLSIHPISFLLGLGAAIVLPPIARVFRSVAVELTAAGMGLYEEAVRVTSEKIETIEDLVAEARAKREGAVASAAASVEAAVASE